MTLIEEAERAEKIRNALIAFTGPCSEDHDATQNINKAISELSSLSCALRHINKLVELDTGAGLDLIHDNLKYVHEDVTYTLGDLWLSLGRLGRSYAVEDYQITWQEITEQAEESSKGKKLHHVLEGYRRFLDSLSKTMETYVEQRRRSQTRTNCISRHVSTPTADKLEHEIKGIHSRRSPRPQRLLSQSKSPSLTRSTSQKKLALRPRAPSRGASQRMQPPMSPEMRQPKSYERQRPMSPDDSSVSSASDATRLRDKPWAPSPPLSPAITISSISQVSSNAPSLETSPNHWAKSVFKNFPSTELPRSNEETRYHEIPGLKEHSYPNQAYDSVLTIIYPEGVRVSLFCRATDYRAKIVVLYRDRRGSSEYGCLPLSELHIRREGPILKICRTRSSGKPQPWLTMKFIVTEKMVLFANTFIAMRSQDSSTKEPPPPVHDDELRDDVSEFAGRIVDSGFTHALRIWHDKITGSIRLQASVFTGELDRTPVWTAFITHLISHLGWCCRTDKKTIALPDLNLHVFSGRYRPYMTDGVFMLKFETKDDADAFTDVIETLRMNVGVYHPQIRSW